jgi:hypothetical protein
MFRHNWIPLQAGFTVFCNKKREKKKKKEIEKDQEEVGECLFS